MPRVDNKLEKLVQVAVTCSATAGNITDVLHGLTDIQGRPVKPNYVWTSREAVESAGTSTATNALPTATLSGVGDTLAFTNTVYTGFRDRNYTVTVMAVTSGHATSVKVSATYQSRDSDGTTSLLEDSGDTAIYTIVGTTEKTIDHGVHLTFGSGGGTVVGDTYTFTMQITPDQVAPAAPISVVSWNKYVISVRCPLASGRGWVFAGY